MIMSEFINTIDVLGDDAVIDSIIQKTITEFKDNRVQTVGQYAFFQCISLDTVDLPNATKIETYAFSGCSALESVDIPSVTAIGTYAFQKCTALTEVCLPLVSDRIIYTFHECTNLAKADLPCVTSIGAETFSKCDALAALILRADKVCTLAHTNAFRYTRIESGNGYVYVPKALIDSYKAATNWSTYANQIRAIEDYPEITGG